MLSYQDLLLYQARYKELVSQAKKEQLLRQALAKSEQRNGLHCRVLSWLGSRLVAWGHSLQERYHTADIAPQKSI